MFIVLIACAGVFDISCDSGSGPGGDEGYFVPFTGGTMGFRIARNSR